MNGYKKIVKPVEGTKKVLLTEAKSGLKEIGVPCGGGGECASSYCGSSNKCAEESDEENDSEDVETDIDSSTEDNGEVEVDSDMDENIDGSADIDSEEVNTDLSKDDAVVIDSEEVQTDENVSAETENTEITKSVKSDVAEKSLLIPESQQLHLPITELTTIPSTIIQRIEESMITSKLPDGSEGDLTVVSPFK